MSVYPGATWRPVAYHNLLRRQPNHAMLLHTNGGGAHLKGWWDQKAAAGSTVGAQYQVFWDGSAECYVDPDSVVFHAYGASRWAFGVETQDDGDPSKPWTDAQITTLAKIGVHHGVPAVLLSGDGPGDGVGWHQKRAAWNQSGHNCPGPARVHQVPDVLAEMASLLVEHQPAPPPAPSSELRVKTLDLRNASTTIVRGAGVKPLQRLLGVTDDGLAGTDTRAALGKAQSRVGATVDYVFGPDTASRLLGE